MPDRARPAYPFVPKSTAYLSEGHFWDIPLSSGRFACGRVLRVAYRDGKRDSRGFLAGLLDWCSLDLPTAENIAGARLLMQGEVHIKAIRENQGAVRGWRGLQLDGIKPFLELSHSPGRDCMLVDGFNEVRPATLQEQKTLYIHSVWGYRVIRNLAEAYFVRGTPPVRRLPWEDYEAARHFRGPADPEH